MVFSKKAFSYLITDLITNLFFGMVIFLSLIIMIQSFSLSEDIINFGADFLSICKIILYISLSFLPTIIPMALLFSLLMTYSRLNMESELVALKSLGLSTTNLFLPALVLSLGCSFISAQLSFYIAPWGQKKMASLFSELAQNRVKLNIKEGVFTTQFKDVVIYADKISKDKSKIDRLFIYNEVKGTEPIAIVAQEGLFKSQKKVGGAFGFIKLNDGHIHKTSNNSYTKVSFNENIINLYDPQKLNLIKKKPMLMSLSEIKLTMSEAAVDTREYLKANIEFNKRWALSLASLLFSFIGFGIATIIQKRQSKSNGFVACVALIVIYWLLFVSSENLANSGKLPVVISLWGANIIYLITGIYLFNKSSKI